MFTAKEMSQHPDWEYYEAANDKIRKLEIKASSDAEFTREDEVVYSAVSEYREELGKQIVKDLEEEYKSNTKSV